MAGEKPDAKPVAAEPGEATAKAVGKKADSAERRHCGFRFAMVLLAGLALPAPNQGCALNSSGFGLEQDDAADAELDSDAVEEDAPAIDSDVDSEEDGAAEDAGPEEADSVPDGLEEDGDVLVEDAPAEDAGCVRTERDEPETVPMPDVGDPASGGSTQDRVSHNVVVGYEGPECDGEAGSTTLDEIEYRFVPGLADFGAAARMGILTANLDGAPGFKVVRAEAACIVTARIHAGARIGIGMPASEISDDVYLVIFSTVGETAGAKWVDISIWDLRRGAWMSDERMEEGGIVALPNGRRVMPTGIDVPGHTVRMDILEPEDIPLCDGERIIRESDGARFVFQRGLPGGWSFFVER